MMNAGKKQAIARPFAAMDLLSPREREVLAAVASGRTNRETGEILGISHRTVEVHRARLMRKLGVQSVAQWVGRAPNGADTFGTHYSEFEVEIGAVRGREQQRILREIRETLSGERGAAWPGVTFGVNTFLTERIEETITGFACTSTL